MDTSTLEQITQYLLIALFVIGYVLHLYVIFYARLPRQWWPLGYSVEGIGAVIIIGIWWAITRDQQ